jgi:rubredoxin
MNEEIERECPHCETERTFYLAARTYLHLGTKRKWHCPECDWGFVRIDDVLDTGADATA